MSFFAASTASGLSLATVSGTLSVVSSVDASLALAGLGKLPEFFPELDSTGDMMISSAKAQLIVDAKSRESKVKCDFKILTSGRIRLWLVYRQE